MTDIIEKIQQQISKNLILLYMKGSPKLPECGFSARAVQAISRCGERFAYIDVLKHTDIRTALPRFSKWPTFPQLWINGELIGGCDIIMEMYQNGELQSIIKNSMTKYKEIIRKSSK